MVAWTRVGFSSLEEGEDACFSCVLAVGGRKRVAKKSKKAKESVFPFMIMPL